MNTVPHTSKNIQQMEDDGDRVNLVEYFDIAFDHRWLVAAVTATAILIGLAYALLARPVYESNLMVQVEDSEKSAGSFLGDAASSLFDVKTPAAGEIEIIKSRLILSQAIENTKLYVEAGPRYTPLIGRWLATRADDLSTPGIFGFGGFVSGNESITVARLDVPSEFEGVELTLTAKGSGAYVISNKELSKELPGVVGANLKDGGFNILISELNAKPGAQFRIARFSKQLTLNRLQDDIRVTEKGKQSGVIDVSWQSVDREKLMLLLNEIGHLYVRQNIERKAAEAEKTLGFLGNQLPEFKRQMESSEDVYNKYRNEKGTISLDDEAKTALTQLVDLQAKLLEAQQKRRDLASRFTDKHPSVQTIDSQIRALSSDISVVNSNIRRMPLVQQDTVRMQRDIKVNTDLYVTLLNSSLQMSLAKEGKVGNVRIVDEAVISERPVKPRKTLIVALAAMVGLLGGLCAAFIRNSFFGGIRNPDEIEAHTGFNVYSTIPLSAAQAGFDRDVKNKLPGVHLLVAAHPDDPAVESLRSLRTALQFAMIDSPNNRILISGATPGVGKSFVSANFAAIVASSGKKVLLIDADLRKGYINQVFSVQRAGGLSELISGNNDFQQSIHAEILPNLDLLTTGVLPPNPAELLMSDSFTKVLDAVSSKYDLVIIDTAPVLVAADTAAVAPQAGTTLLVARAGKTHLGELNESAKRLMHVGSVVNGVILNAMDMTRRHYGSYGYKYGGYKYTQYKYEKQAAD